VNRSELLWPANSRGFLAVHSRMSGNSTSAPAFYMSKVGLGYGIAIAVGILVLITTIMLTFYVCAMMQDRTPIRSAADTGIANATFIRVAMHDQINTSATAAPGMEVPGLDQATLDSYPTSVFSEEKKKEGDQSGCSICLGDYKDSDLLRMLPDCGHAFHLACIDSWMKIHATCPMCRSSPLPSPLSTPLAEVVPLARHSARIQR